MHLAGVNAHLFADSFHPDPVAQGIESANLNVRWEALCHLIRDPLVEGQREDWDVGDLSAHHFERGGLGCAGKGVNEKVIRCPFGSGDDVELFRRRCVHFQLFPLTIVCIDRASDIRN